MALNLVNVPAEGEGAAAKKAERKSISFWEGVFIRFKKRKIAIFGFYLMMFIVGVCVYSYIGIDYETQVVQQNVRNKLKPPSFEHPFGTDGFGRDILARVIYGSRYSLLIGFSVMIFALLTGGTIGAVSGYFGGRTDNILMRLMDVLIAIPSTLMAIAVVSALGPGLRNLIIAIGVSNTPYYARIIRSSVLTIKDNEYIEAAIAVGSDHGRIILKHVFPNALPAIIVQATLGVGVTILTSAGLSYLGLGIMPPAPEWGNMLNEGRMYIRYSPWLVLFPGIAIVLTVLALNLFGDGIRDAIDPKLKD